MLNMESDDRKEAQFCREEPPFFADDDDIAIPKIYDEYTTAKVLTLEYLPGVHLKEYMAGTLHRRSGTLHPPVVSLSIPALLPGALVFRRPQSRQLHIHGQRQAGSN